MIASAVTSAKALTACAWELLPKSKIWTAPQIDNGLLELRLSGWKPRVFFKKIMVREKQGCELKSRKKKR